MSQCKIILVGTGEVIYNILLKCLENENLIVLGVIPDKSVKKEVLDSFIDRVHQLELKTLDFQCGELNDADLIYVNEYRKIIPSKYISKYNFINCHAGILPMYRGFGANAWAIINNETEIGYTVHKMNEKFDDGDIFYVHRIPIEPNQLYGDVHGKMIKSMIEDTPLILYNIYTRKLKAYKQEGKRIYCHKFHPEMGNLDCFSVASQFIYNLYRCMAKPLGTGLYFYYKSRRYNVSYVDMGSNREICDYIGIPGKVVNIENNELWVKTKDNVIILGDICDINDNIVNLNAIFTIGCEIAVPYREE